jgi:alcohol dehydrogenase class IV
MHVFRFSTAGEIICGPSVQEALPDIIRSLKAANILVVTDPNILRSGLIETVLKAVEATGGDIRLIDSILPEPPTGQIDTLQKELKDSSFDLVVAIGGGSVLDSAKLLSVLINSSLTVEKSSGSTWCHALASLL